MGFGILEVAIILGILCLCSMVIIAIGVALFFLLRPKGE
jgi:hypothetical protein